MPLNVELVAPQMKRSSFDREQFHSLQIWFDLAFEALDICQTFKNSKGINLIVFPLKHITLFPRYTLNIKH